MKTAILEYHVQKRKFFHKNKYHFRNSLKKKSFFKKRENTKNEKKSHRHKEVLYPCNSISGISIQPKKFMKSENIS